MEKKKIPDRTVLYIAVVLILLCITVLVLLCKKLAGVIGTTAGEEEKIVTKEEVQEQIGSTEYSVSAGKNITYTFQTDGVLRISGTGATESYGTLEEGQLYLLRELYEFQTGEAPETTEQASWLQPVLDRVTGIVVEEGVTELGKGACSMFFYADTVSIPVSMKKIGQAAFLGTGQYAETAVEYTGLEEASPEYDATSFLVITEEYMAYRSVSDGETLKVRAEEEQGTIPELSLLAETVAMGENVKYRLYENGVLVVTGAGATYDFSSLSEMTSYLAEELYCTSRSEVKERWFDRVVEIYVTEGIERIGDYALADYRNVVVVSVDGTETEYGSRALFNCGMDTEEKTVWNIDLEKAVWQDNSFSRCRNVPLP